ncbi:uncharacterized protein LOC135424361 [Pseudopipra pipra]|uniref:uncharacterized protein LOC135424361 n=1 Tax=Pseudopipra pipra TaxID=415032 RepID=UPI003138F1B9
MAARAPLPPPSPLRFREAFILLPDLRRHPDPRPAPAAPSPRAASRSTHGGRSDGDRPRGNLGAVGDAAGGRGRSSASPAAIGDCRQGKRQVTKLMEKKTKGLEAPSFPSVAVGVPAASGRTNPVAFMSNVLCCVCLQTECTPFIHLFREYRPEYERLRKTLNPQVNLCLREKAQNKQKREQLEHLWKDMGSVCVQGSTLAELPREEILQRGFPPDKP